MLVCEHGNSNQGLPRSTQGGSHQLLEIGPGEPSRARRMVRELKPQAMSRCRIAAATRTGTACVGALAIVFALLAGTSATAADLNSKPWLTQINQYRMMAGLESVEEVAAISAADTNHARYLVKRFEVEQPEQVDIYSENRATEWSTPSGAAAASLSNIALRTGAEQPSDLETQIRQVIDDWMTDPFQRLPILDPELRKVGLGVYRERNFTSVVLQVRTPAPPQEALMGNAEDYRLARPLAENSSKYPIMFPPAGSDIGLVAFEGGGWPNLFTSCPGLGLPVGLPITLELGPSAQDQNILRHSITTNQ